MREFKFPHTRTRSQSRHGFTLIEIMVALAIFVFGAVAILRIFPSGLGVVRDTEDRAIATRMSRTTTVAFESKIAYAPEAVFNRDPASTFPFNWAETRNSANQALAYTGGVNSASIPRGPQDLVQETALGRFKSIRGERQTISIAAIAPSVTTTPYVLVRYPHTGNVVVYREDTIDGVTVDSNGQLNFSKSTQSDGSSFSSSIRPPAPLYRHAFAASPTITDTTYYVSYKWATSATAPVQGVTEEHLLLPGDATWVNGTDGYVLNTPASIPGSFVIPGSVQVRFRQVVGLITGSATDATVGLVRLPGLTPGDTVFLDYDVADWSVLAHDEAVSTPNNTNLVPPPAATLGRWNINVPMLGIDPDAGVTSLFVRPATTLVPNPTIDLAQRGAATTQTGLSSIFDISTAGGRFTYDTANFTKTRTVYRTLDNWTHQLGVAARSYEPFMAAGRPARSPREGWREYVWLPGTANGGKLFFQPSEAGKVVMVTYEYLEGTTPRLISNAMVPIAEEVVTTATFAGFPGNFAPLTNQVSVAQLTDFGGNAIGNNLIAIRSVRGVSTLARTAWIKNQRYSQVIAKGMRPLAQ